MFGKLVFRFPSGSAQDLSPGYERWWHLGGSKSPWKATKKEAVRQVRDYQGTLTQIPALCDKTQVFHFANYQWNVFHDLLLISAARSSPQVTMSCHQLSRSFQHKGKLSKRWKTRIQQNQISRTAWLNGICFNESRFIRKHCFFIWFGTERKTCPVIGEVGCSHISLLSDFFVQKPILRNYWTPFHEKNLRYFSG